MTSNFLDSAVEKLKYTELKSTLVQTVNQDDSRYRRVSV